MPHEVGQAAGIHWFALGMAPLSGSSSPPGSPLWNRVIGAFSTITRRSTTVMDAAAKKVNPIGEQRYLAIRGAASAAHLADVSSLVAAATVAFFLR